MGADVTTFAVVWIEMEVAASASAGAACHHLGGGVD